MIMNILAISNIIRTLWWSAHLHAIKKDYDSSSNYRITHAIKKDYVLFSFISQELKLIYTGIDLM